jgi:hypothetical protein
MYQPQAGGEACSGSQDTNVTVVFDLMVTITMDM